MGRDIKHGVHMFDMRSCDDSFTKQTKILSDSHMSVQKLWINCDGQLILPFDRALDTNVRNTWTPSSSSGICESQRKNSVQIRFVSTRFRQERDQKPIG